MDKVNRLLLFKKIKLFKMSMIQMILKTKKHLRILQKLEAKTTNMQKYSIKKLYIAMKGGFQKVPWRMIICNNRGAN